MCITHYLRAGIAGVCGPLHILRLGAMAPWHGPCMVYFGGCGPWPVAPRSLARGLPYWSNVQWLGAVNPWHGPCIWGLWPPAKSAPGGWYPLQNLRENFSRTDASEVREYPPHAFSLFETFILHLRTHTYRHFPECSLYSYNFTIDKLPGNLYNRYYRNPFR